MDRRELIHGYATALFQVAAAEGALDRVSDELFAVAKSLEQSYDLHVALTDINVPAERKQAVIDELLGDRVAPVTRNLVDFVVSQGRAGDLSEMVDGLAHLAAEARDMVMAEVRCAVPVDEDLRQRLAEALSHATGRTIEVKVVVDPGVIGGVYAKVGDQVIDGTVRRKLAELKDRLEVGG